MRNVFYLLLIINILWPIHYVRATTDTFEALVDDVILEETITREDGSINIQQNLKLFGLTNTWRGQTVLFNGISQLDVISQNRYQAGDRVVVSHSVDADGQDIFYVIDYVRRTQIYLLLLVFIVITLIIGRLKGLKALASLLISALVIIYFILPQILQGRNPLIIGLLGAFLIIIAAIYLTEGIKLKSHLAILAIALILIIIGLLSWLVTALAHLSGLGQEEVLFLVDAGHGTINFAGLLLAGILIGTLGALDDVVISQIEAVAQLRAANPALSSKELFILAYRIGATHLGAMINTLFLAYAGAALPLLLLFSIKQPPFLTIAQIINQENIAIEIVRTLVGSLGIIMAMPLATFLATHWPTLDHKHK